jgi:hypothetical protein
MESNIKNKCPNCGGDLIQMYHPSGEQLRTERNKAHLECIGKTIVTDSGSWHKQGCSWFGYLNLRSGD